MSLRVVAVAGLVALGASGVVSAAAIEADGHRLTTFAEAKPAELPRDRPAPTSLRLELTSSSGGEAATPDLTGFTIELSRNIALRTDALRAGAVVGHGYAVTELTPPYGEAPRTIAGPMRLTLRRSAGVPRLSGAVTTAEVEYTIPFSVEPAQGPYGTKLAVRRMRRVVGRCVADHPDCFGSAYTLSGVYGRISRLELRLEGALVRGTCPAPAGAAEAVFPLARFELRYGGGGALRQAVRRGCLVDG